MPFQFVLVGGGGLARELAGWFQLNANASTENTRGYLACQEDSTMEAYGLPWLGSTKDFKALPNDRMVLAIGEPAIKAEVISQLALDPSRFVTLVHSSAIVHPTATLGHGVIICPLSAVSADAVVENFVTVNLLCTIGHDVQLGAYSTLSAHVDLTGLAQVAVGVFFGSGARVLPGITIGGNARIGAGATVMRNVLQGATVYTTPAKRL